MKNERRDFDCYPAYKDSGVEWLGRVPEHWEVRKLKYAVSFRGGGTPTKSNALFWDGHIPWASPKDMTRAPLSDTTDHISEDAVEASAANIVAPGAVLMVVRSGILRRTIPVAINTVPMAINQDMKALLPKNGIVQSRYLHGLIQGNEAFLLKEWTKQGATVESIEHSLLANLLIPIPPPSEQTAIVRFLERAVHLLRRYIGAKERLIELLEEWKGVLIDAAITGRVDVRTGQPYPAYKDSGVEWLGRVPEHWERRRLKTLLRVVDRRSSTGEETLLSLRRDHGVVVYSEHFVRPPQGRTLVGYKQLAVGQLVVNRLQANNGLVFCSGIDGLVSPDYSVFDKTVPLQMKYLSDLLRTSVYRSHFRRVSTGLGTGTAGFLRLYDDVFLSTTVFLPPEHEQVSVLGYVALQVRKIEGLIASAERGLELFDEYRTRLIADVVTGKRDVRGAAAKLPETDPLAGGRDRADTIYTESNLHSTESHMTKEAIP